MHFVKLIVNTSASVHALITHYVRIPPNFGVFFGQKHFRGGGKTRVQCHCIGNGAAAVVQVTEVAQPQNDSLYLEVTRDILRWAVHLCDGEQNFVRSLH